MKTDRKTLFDTVKAGDRVVGKTTGLIYTVHIIDRGATEYEDAIILRNQRLNPVEYTRAQFNHHFKKKRPV